MENVAHEIDSWQDWERGLTAHRCMNKVLYPTLLAAVTVCPLPEHQGPTPPASSIRKVATVSGAAGAKPILSHCHFAIR